MQRIILTLSLVFCLSVLPVVASAGWFSDDTLVTVDGQKHTTEDFKHWWQFWKDEGQALPETPDVYVDFLLLKEEAERMDMANTAEFKRKERVFLQSRGLLMLKNETVDSQINVTEEQIEALYQEKYQPRWLVQQMKFSDEESAQATWQEISAGNVTVDELREREVESGGPEGYGESWLRPAKIDPGWLEIFQKTAIGDVVDPELHKKGDALYYMKEVAQGSEEDKATVREEIGKALWRKQEDQLTAKLLSELIEKYQVKIDDERLAAIDMTADLSSYSDEPVITTNKENVSEKQFMAVVRKLLKTRPKAKMEMLDEEKAQKFKEETANNIVHQSVTNWWTLDRHFEKEEPFKWAYQFNRDYRLVSMLEQQLFKLKVEPSGEELERLYKEKVKYYTIPAQAKLYIVDETQGPIDKVWADVAVGNTFRETVKELLGHGVRPVETPLNHLDPQVRSVVSKLAPGETSQIFEARGARVLVHLVSHTPEQELPLEKVKDSLISGYKRESYDKARATYLEALRKNANVEIDKGNWESLQKELGGA